MRFLGNVLATVVGLFVFIILFFFTSALIIGLVSSGSQDATEVPTNSVLKLTLDRPIQEKITEENPFQELEGFPGVGAAPMGLIDLLGEIDNAKLDPNIKGIYLEVGLISQGFATLEEIRNALVEFKDSGKFIIAYGEIYTEGAYYLASVADHIYLAPEGIMIFDGLGTEIIYLKEFLNNLGIEPEVFRVGEYKSAVEPFLRNDMSEENREQIKAYLSDLHEHYLSSIEASRGIAFEDLKSISDNALVRSPEDAVGFKLVDDTLYFDQVVDKLKESSGVAKDEKLSLLTYGQYKKAPRLNRQEFSRNKVAVIVGEGQIISGNGGSGFLGGNKIADEIRKARNNESIKAIVLRINSPGGSALASDVMWREVKLAAQEKPVIASMSDLAASGGYYMAMAADTIVAYPNTITGSIGIFSLLFNAEDLLNNKLGLHFESVSTGKLSNLGSPTDDFTQAEREYLQTNVDRGYKTFVSKAAEGRNMPVDSLESLASGRVWTGNAAVENGLVDVLGDLEDAIEIAATSAGVENDYMVRYYPEKKDFLSDLLNKPIEKVGYLFAPEQDPLLKPVLEQVRFIQAMEGPQALLPYRFKIE